MLTESLLISDSPSAFPSGYWFSSIIPIVSTPFTLGLICYFGVSSYSPENMISKEKKTFCHESHAFLKELSSRNVHFQPFIASGMVLGDGVE